MTRPPVSERSEIPTAASPAERPALAADGEAIQQTAQRVRPLREKTLAEIRRVVVGMEAVTEQLLIALLAGGHVLIEGVPGVAKTTLSKAFARTIGGQYQRIQFTPDLLPSDVTGTYIFDRQSNEFVLRKGPIFCQILLADEVNRAPAKTQSALLEAMQENQVTIEGATLPLPQPFLVLATQNPVEQEGVYRLPEAQLDRFLLRTNLGYPDHDTTVALLADAANRDRSAAVSPLITSTAVSEMGELAARVHVDSAILSYVSRLAEETRRLPQTSLGVSTRGCIALVRAAKTWAAAHGRTYVVPDDIKDLVLPVLTHRIMLTADAEFAGVSVDALLASVLADVAPPSERGAA